MSLSHSSVDVHPGIDRLAYSMREAAQAIGICERSVWQAIKDGRLRASRIGRSVRISAAELERFLEATAASPTEGEVSE
jgi:excisionase family DNA binding protein